MKYFFENMKIKTRLTVTNILTFSIILVLMSSVTLVYIKKDLDKKVDTELTQTTTTLANMLKSNMDTTIINYLKGNGETSKKIVNHYYEEYKKGNLSEEEAKTKAEQMLLENKIGLTGYVYVINSKGKIQVHPKIALGEDLSQYDFVQNQMSRKEGYMEYMWKNKGEEKERPKALYMTYFEEWDWIISVSSYREEFMELINVKDFRDSILSIKLGNTGYPAVFDSKGNAIIHPFEEGKNLYDAQDANGKYFIREITEKKKGRSIYYWKNKGEKKAREKIAIYTYIKEQDLIIMATTYTEEMYSILYRIQRIFLMAIFISAIISSVGSMFFANSFTKPILALKNASQRISEGNLNVDISMKGKNEIAVLGQAFHRMVENLKELVANSQRTSNTVNNVANELGTMLQQTSMSISQTSMATETIATGATEQVKLSNESLKSVQRLDDHANIIQENANSMHEAAEKTKAMSMEGLEVVKNLTEKQQDSEASIQNVNKVVMLLEKQVKEITNFIETISQIAGQTNLLALNAAIEAARAGEQGQGFAVVAQEIRKLSEQSSVSAEKIKDVIIKIMEGTKKAVASVEEAKIISEDQRKSVEDTKNIFKELEEATFISIEKIQNVYEKIKGLNEVKMQVFSYMDKIVDVTEHGAASTQEVSATMEEQSGYMDEINNYVEKMIHLAKEMSESISRFKLHD